jgi:branched-chain amino acid transport system substrate-binding protein
MSRSQESTRARRRGVKGAGAALVLAFVAAACGGDNKSSTNTTSAPVTTASTTNTSGGEGSTSSTGGSATTTGGSSAASLPDNGPCDTAKPPYPIGIVTVFESPVLSLGDQVTAAEASVKAFNARGGIGGHCMKLTTCDSKGDPNKEADCARQLVQQGIVATVNDTTSFNPQAVMDVFTAAGLPRMGVSPAVQELNSPVTYAIGAGGTGTTFMMVPPCTRAGKKKIAAIHVDTPQIGPLFDALAPMVKAYGAQIVTKIPVSAGTTDYQQFILAAKNAGADCAILPLGENEAVQVLQAAQQLGTDLTFSTSLGTFSRKTVQGLGPLGDQMLFNAELPPVTADQTKWPINAQIIKDLSASGNPQLQADTLKSSPVRSWVAVYDLVTIIQKFGTPDTITRAAVTAAIKKAKDVDQFGLTPPWTPSASVTGPGPFASVSQPWYYQVKFDTKAGKFVVLPTQLNVVAELGGKIDYPQPTASGGSSSGGTATTTGSGGAGTTSTTG